MTNTSGAIGAVRACASIWGAVALAASGFLANPAFAQCLGAVLQPPSALTIKGGPTALDAGDLNGDGVIDLAVVLADRNAVAVMRGDGAGGFGVPTEIRVGTKPSSVTIGDVNGDGANDSVVVNTESNSVSILLNDGHAGFATTTDIPVDGSPVFVAAVDLNKDGALDLAVPAARDGTVAVLLGDGSGGFSAARRFGVAANPRWVAAGELAMAETEESSNVDLAVVNADTNNVSVLRGDGTGSFSDPFNLPVGVFPVAVAAGDLNRDRKTDLVVANQGSDNVSVLIARPGGGPIEQQYEAWLGPSSLATGDLDSDGNVDVVVTNPDAKTVSLLFGDGRGALSTPDKVAVPMSATFAAMRDVNGDGKPDLVLAAPQANAVAVMLNACLPPLSWWVRRGAALLTLAAILILPWFWRSKRHK